MGAGVPAVFRLDQLQVSTRAVLEQPKQLLCHPSSRCWRAVQGPVWCFTQRKLQPRVYCVHRDPRWTLGAGHSQGTRLPAVLRCPGSAWLPRCRQGAVPAVPASPSLAALARSRGQAAPRVLCPQCPSPLPPPQGTAGSSHTEIPAPLREKQGTFFGMVYSAVGGGGSCSLLMARKGLASLLWPPHLPFKIIIPFYETQLSLSNWIFLRRPNFFLSLSCCIIPLNDHVWARHFSNSSFGEDLIFSPIYLLLSGSLFRHKFELLTRVPEDTSCPSLPLSVFFFPVFHHCEAPFAVHMSSNLFGGSLRFVCTRSIWPSGLYQLEWLEVCHGHMWPSTAGGLIINSVAILNNSQAVHF